MPVVASLLVSLMCAGGAEGQPGGDEPGRTAQEGMDVRQAALSRLLGTVAGIDNPQGIPGTAYSFEAGDSFSKFSTFCWQGSRKDGIIRQG